MQTTYHGDDEICLLFKFFLKVSKYWMTIILDSYAKLFYSKIQN